MINKKKILEELYDHDPSLKLEEEKIEKLVDFLALNNPNIAAGKAFKTRLGNKLTTIGEFKQIQPKTKYSFMSFMRPLFILVVGVFILAQFKNYLNLKELQVRSSLEPQNLEMLISNNSDSTTGQSEEQLLMKESGKTESQIIVDTEPTQLSESIGNTNITSDQNSANNETQNSEQTIIEKTPSEDSDLESTERIPENQIILDQNEITDEGDTGTSLESVSSEKLLSTSDPSPPDNSDSSEELSGNISSATDQDTGELPSVSKMSSDEKYYTCEKGKIVIDDSIAQRRMIKSYCDNVLGEIVNGGGNIKYYLCTLPNKKEVGIEYIAEQLCK